MSTPIHPTKKFIPATMTAEGAVEALRAVEPAWRWKAHDGALISGSLGNYTLLMSAHEGFWFASLAHQHLDMWGYDSVGEVANTLAECALSAVEELSEKLLEDEFTATYIANRSTDAAA